MTEAGAKQSKPMGFWNHARGGVELGLLVGLFEAISIVRWDLPLDSGTALGMAVLWGVAIVGVNVLAWSLVSIATRGSHWLGPALYLTAVFAARFFVNDRFRVSILLLVPIAGLLLWQHRHRWTLPLLAIVLALPGLWARVPNSALPEIEEVMHHVPGALLVVALGFLMRRGQLVASAAAVLLFGAATLPWQLVRGEPPAGKPNVLFVLVDTLRQDELGPWAGDDVTPEIVKLASEGARFDDMITVIPKTPQSVAANLTGLYPVNHGLRNLHHGLSEERRTLAEVLHDAGYATGAFVHNGWIMRGRGFEQGFDHFRTWYELERPYGPLRYVGFVTALDFLTLGRIKAFDGNTNAANATDAAMAWMKDAKRPFFAYVHYFDPHWPYRPPGENGECLVNNIEESKYTRGQMIFQNDLPEAENERARQLYSKEIAYNMRDIGRMFDWVDDSGIGDNTIVVFTADHAHHLGDHGVYFFHGSHLYEPVMKIPLVMRWPGHIEAGKVEKGVARNIDVMPTLLGLIGLKGPKMDGQDMFKGMADIAYMETDTSGFVENKRRYVKGFTGNVRAARTSRWKLIYTPRKGDGVWELYDLHDDPGELKNLLASGEAPEEVVKPLMAEIAAHIPKDERAALEKLGNRFDRVPKGAAKAPEDGGGAVDKGGADEALLRSLGYAN